MDDNTTNSTEETNAVDAFGTVGVNPIIATSTTETVVSETTTTSDSSKKVNAMGSVISDGSTNPLEGQNVKATDSTETTTASTTVTTEEAVTVKTNTGFVNDDQVTQDVQNGINANKATLASLGNQTEAFADDLTNSALNMVSDGDFSAESLAFMKENAIDAGKSFLKGAVTSTFANQIDVYNQSKKVLSQGADLLNKAPQMVSDIVSSTTKGVISYIENYITTYTKELLSVEPWVTGITYYTSYYTTLATNSASYILTYLSDNMDKAIQKRLEELEDTNGKQSYQISKFSYTMGNIRSAVDTATSYMQDGVKLVLAYIQNGPDWVKKQINSYVELGEGYITKYLDYAFADVVRMRDDFIKDTGEKAGTAIAKKLNEAEKKAMSKAITELKETQRVASAKALSALMKATAKIVAKLGPLVGKAIKAATNLAMKELKKGIEKGIQAVINEYSEEIKKAEEKVTAAMDTVDSAIDTAADALGEGVAATTSWAADAMSGASEAISSVESSVENKIG